MRDTSWLITASLVKEAVDEAVEEGQQLRVRHPLLQYLRGRLGHEGAPHRLVVSCVNTIKSKFA